MPASSAQVSQLVLQVDAQVAVAQRSLQDLARTVQQSSDQMNSSLGSTAGAIDRSNVTFAKFGAQAQASRFAMEDLNRSLTRSIDAYGAGMPPLRILTMELGRLDRAANALGASGGSLGAIAGFLSGPWGLAIIVGVAALSKLVLKHIEASGALDDAYAKLVKHKQATELNAQAEDIWSHSLDGLIERSEKLNKELEKRLQTQTALQQKTLSQAQNDFGDAMSAADKIDSDPKSTQKQRDDAQKAIHDTSIELHNAQVLAAQDAGEAIASMSQSAKVWADQQKQALEVLQTLHPELAEKGVADGMLASFNDLKDAIDKAAEAGFSFNSTVTAANALNQALAHGTITAAVYDQRMKSLAQSLRDAAAASKDAVKQFEAAVIGAEGTGPNKLGSQAAGFGQFMPNTWESYFKRLFPSQASTMSNPQIDDLRNNKDVATAIIDAATQDYVKVLKAAGQNISAASLYTVHVLGSADARKFLAASDDQSVFQALGGTRHAGAVVAQNGKLFAGTVGQAKSQLAARIGDSSGAVSTAAGSIQKQIEDAAKKALEQQDQFNKQDDQLDAELLQIKKSLTADYNQQAAIAGQELDAQIRAKLDEIQKEQDSGKITAAQGAILKAKTEELAAVQRALIEQQRIVKSLEADQAALDQRYGFALDDLKAANDNATTQAEHRRIQLQILDIQYQQKQVDLEILLAKQQQLGDIQGAALTQSALARLPEQKAEDRSSVINGTMDPLQAWAKQVPKTAADINQALQSIEVQGLDNLSSAIADVVTGTKSLKQAFGEMAQSIIGQIIQMTIKMLVFRTLSSIFGSAFGGSIPSPDFSMAATVSLPTASPLPSLPGFSAGGMIDVGGNGGVDQNLLSINNIPRAMVSDDETLAVVPRASRVSLPRAANNNRPAMVRVEVAGSDYFDVRVAEVAGAVVQIVRPGIVKEARSNAIRSMTRRPIGG